MNKETMDMLVEKAMQARTQAYAPYSHFAVGAALLTEDGKCYTGANIENASYTPTVCAERVAFFDAIHDGARNFRAIAIVGGLEDAEVNRFCPPCGVCRQVMSEFCTGEFLVLLFDGKEIQCYTLDELFPYRFSLSNNEKGEKT